MLLKIIVVGKIKEHSLAERCAEYSKRLFSYGKLEIIELPDSTPDNEGKNILRELAKDRHAKIIVLSEEGKLFTTCNFAEKIATYNSKIIFVIGGSYGLAPEVKAHADLLWSLSPLTFTHEIARMLLLEQLYRVLNLNSGGHYHH